MNSKNFLGKNVKVLIDRPLGSTHPKHDDIIYGVNYGYLPNTVSGDSEELDVYVLGVSNPIETFEGVCIAIVHRLHEDDDKLIVAPKEIDFTNEEIRSYISFQERFFEYEIWR